MYRIFILLLLASGLCACSDNPKTITATKEAEQSNPEDFLKVNYEVRRNLLAKKIVEGEIINTGKNISYSAVTLSIKTYSNDGDEGHVTYTVPGRIAPGGHEAFKYKPEGNPERVEVFVRSASVD